MLTINCNSMRKHEITWSSMDRSKPTVEGRRLNVFELWNEEYRDGIKTRGDKIGMALCIIKPLNDVRQKVFANH